MAAIQILFLVCGLVGVVYSAVVDYDAACNADDTCDGTKHLYCKRDYSSTQCLPAKCTCTRDYKRVVDACVKGLLLDEDCTAATGACIVDNSECGTGTPKLCTCAPSHPTKLSKYHCALTTYKPIDATCTTATDKCYYESERTLIEVGCPPTATCQCENSKKRGKTCTPIKIGDSCSLTDDCPMKSECTGAADAKKCACIKDYEAITDKTACVITTGQIAAENPCVAIELKCTPSLSCAACGATDDLTCAQRTGLYDAVCSSDSECASNVAVCKSGKCACPAGYTAFGATRCIPTGALDSECLANEDCTVADSACTAGTCACASTHVRHLDGCIQACTDANKDTVCPSAQGKECDTISKKCKCKATFIALDDTCVSGKLNSKCTSDADHCKNLANSQCKEQKCICAEGYTASEETCKKSGAGIKAAWMPIVILTGLLPILYMMLF